MRVRAHGVDAKIEDYKKKYTKTSNGSPCQHHSANDRVH
jgi:hypothetical protein